MDGSEGTFSTARVVQAWDETATLRGLRLDLSALHLHHRRPGQVIRVRLPGGEDSPYAIATAPAPHGQMELLLKHGSSQADELIAKAKPGSLVEVTRPFGQGFPIEPADGRRVWLFATGSGITPIRALLHHLLARGRSEAITLLYGQRTPADFAYAAEFERWTAAGVRLLLSCSRAEANGSDRRTNVRRGYIQDFLTEALTGQPLDGHSVAYLCGVPAMVEEVSHRLLQSGLPREQLLLNV